jgi:small subunit ribosomal protein S17
MMAKKSRKVEKPEKKDAAKLNKKQSHTAKDTAISHSHEKFVERIGIPVKNPPKEVCDDELCPYHGHLKIRGKIFQGEVVSAKMDKTVVVEWSYLRKIKKLKRYMRCKTKLAAHNPPCINAKEGDVVRIAECRPISKTKSFVVIERVKRA